jgi:hypothetical protein
MSTAVVAMLQHILTDFNGARPEEDIITEKIKILLTTKGKYDCAGEAQQRL